jgi:ATP-binding cassette subfamily C protein
MRMMASFFRAYPGRTTVMLLALLLSGVAEGVGLSALLPLLNIAVGQDVTAAVTGVNTPQQSEFERTVVEVFATVGISPTLGNMLLIIVIGVALKSVFLLIAQRQVGYTAAQVATDLRLEMLRAVLLSKWEYFLHQPVGRLTNALATSRQ